ncbi:hypothetical protein AAVH_15854 [Aphelenchoides avenae]|nr:hypothetical protein AAVH_15854 [Aphelenchus avenae]
MTKVTIQVNLEFEMFSERFAFGNVYNFVRDSLFENIHRKVNEAKVGDVPNLAPTAGTWKKIEGICSFRGTLREAAVEKLQSDPQLLSDWLHEAIEGIRHSIEPRHDTKRAGQLFLEAYAERQDDYDANFADPFIRAAVAH